MPTSIALCSDVVVPLINSSYIDIYPKESFGTLQLILDQSHSKGEISDFITP